MATAFLNGKKYHIEFRSTKIGDTVLSLRLMDAYTATIQDADELN